MVPQTKCCRDRLLFDSVEENVTVSLLLVRIESIFYWFFLYSIVIKMRFTDIVCFDWTQKITIECWRSIEWKTTLFAHRLFPLSSWKYILDGIRRDQTGSCLSSIITKRIDKHNWQSAEACARQSVNSFVELNTKKTMQMMSECKKWRKNFHAGSTWWSRKNT